MKRAVLIVGFTALSLGYMVVPVVPVMAQERGPGKMGGGPQIDFSAADATFDGLLSQPANRPIGEPCRPPIFRALGPKMGDAQLPEGGEADNLAGNEHI